MNKKLLEQFFREHTIESDTPTAPALAHFYLSLENDPDAGEEIRTVMDEAVFDEQPARQAEVLAERREIETLAACEQVIRFMRRGTDPMNQHILANKALAFEEEIVPQLVRMLKTSMNDGFIETAIRVLTKSNKDTADDLIGFFPDMRYPYTQAMVLVVLGFKADETHIPWFIDQYKKLERLYPDESHCQGAYYALCEMDNRFYPAAGKGRKR